MRAAVSCLLVLPLLVAAPPAGRAQSDAAHAPVVGDVIPDMDAQNIDGSMRRISFGKADAKGPDTVLLFFLSSCPTCHRMIPEWNRAYERRPKDLQVVGLVMDQEPLGFWDTIKVLFPVVRAPQRSVLQQLKIQRAPLTLRVGPGGKVKDVALGIVDPIKLGEIFRP
jgi:peroxiredoxin